MPKTAAEASVRQAVHDRENRRVTASATERNIRFLIGFLVAERVCATEDLLSLSSFANANICERLHNAMRARQAGSARIYQIFLLVDKVSACTGLG